MLKESGVSKSMKGLFFLSPHRFRLLRGEKLLQKPHPAEGHADMHMLHMRREAEWRF